MFDIQITELAKEDIQQTFQWWSTHRSEKQAADWYEQILRAMATLRRMPERCPRIPETGLSRSDLRQLLFGIGNRPTHRIIFGLDAESRVVTILRVRHHGQDAL